MPKLNQLKVISAASEPEVRAEDLLCDSDPDAHNQQLRGEKTAAAVFGTELSLVGRNRRAVDASTNTSQDTSDQEMCNVVSGALDCGSDTDDQRCAPHGLDAADLCPEKEADYIARVSGREGLLSERLETNSNIPGSIRGQKTQQ